MPYTCSVNLLPFLNIERQVGLFFHSVKAWGKALVLGKKPSIARGSASGSLYIIGNGPSFKAALAQEGERLQQAQTLGVNLLPLTPYFTQLQPNYLLAIDKKFWQFNDTEERYANYRAYFERLEADVTWPLTVLLPVGAQERIKALNLQNPNLRFQFFNKNGVDGLPGLIFPLWRSNRASPRCWNVMICALYNALNLGFTRLVLLGADHSWFETMAVDEGNQVVVKQVHFYDSHQEITYVPYTNGEVNRAMTMPELCHQFEVIFSTYHLLGRYARSKGAVIYNATPDSYIDAYPRQALKALLDEEAPIPKQ